MGYRNSTPTNVMLAEIGWKWKTEQGLSSEKLLDKNNSENKEVKGKMNRLEMLEYRYRKAKVRPRGMINMFIESWKDTKRKIRKI